jgi:hypothetical protein
MAKEWTYRFVDVSIRGCLPEQFPEEPIGQFSRNLVVRGSPLAPNHPGIAAPTIIYDERMNGTIGEVVDRAVELAGTYEAGHIIIDLNSLEQQRRYFNGVTRAVAMGDGGSAE